MANIKFDDEGLGGRSVVFELANGTKIECCIRMNSPDFVTVYEHTGGKSLAVRPRTSNSLVIEVIK
jgi:hypothetical protein